MDHHLRNLRRKVTTENLSSETRAYLHWLEKLAGYTEDAENCSQLKGYSTLEIEDEVIFSYLMVGQGPSACQYCRGIVQATPPDTLEKIVMEFGNPSVLHYEGFHIHVADRFLVSGVPADAHCPKRHWVREDDYSSSVDRRIRNLLQQAADCGYEYVFIRGKQPSFANAAWNFCSNENCERCNAFRASLPRRNPLSDVEFYHGSPYSPEVVADFSDFELVGGVLFLTPCQHVAHEYTRQLMASGRRPKNRPVQDKKVVYTVRISISDDAIFDTRKFQHAELLNELVDRLIEDKDDDRLDRFRDLVHTPSLPGCNVETFGLLPSWGSVHRLKIPLIERGFRGAWISEGSQGASLALFYPQDAEIVETKFPE